MQFKNSQLLYVAALRLHNAGTTVRFSDSPRKLEFGVRHDDRNSRTVGGSGDGIRHVKVEPTAVSVLRLVGEVLTGMANAWRIRHEDENRLQAEAGCEPAKQNLGADGRSRF